LSTATTKLDLLNSLKDREFRSAFNLENVYTTICFQIRARREQRDMSQGTFGKLAKMAQERISILEDPNADSKPTLNTLLRLADAADVGLEVRFVPFSDVLLHSVHTDIHALEVDSFDEELPAIEEQIAYEVAVESLEPSVLGITRASNNLVAIPRKTEYAPTPQVNIPAKKIALGQSSFQPATQNANAADVA
jgi:transcriptional regulator with XRE-family HTH domain